MKKLSNITLKEFRAVLTALGLTREEFLSLLESL